MAIGGRSDQTRRTMIEAAEKLFAERGFDGLSLREVALASGQRNHSAVQYHFGSKSGLIEAVFEARMAPIDARRRELLLELDGAGRSGDVVGLVEAMVRPLAEAIIIVPPGWWGRFLGQVYRTSPELMGTERPVMGALAEVGRRLFELLVEVPRELRGHRLRLALRSNVQMLADHEYALGKEPIDLSGNRSAIIIAEQIDLVVAMLTAPPSDGLREAIARS
jgi:AcrR family transcriptional regulator